MIALDTNVLVHLVTGDDAAQARRGAARINTGDAFFVPLTVALGAGIGIAWCLIATARSRRSDVRALMSIRNLRFADDQVITRAPNQYRSVLDFADALHIEAAHSCSAMLSFNTKFRNRGASTAGRCAMKLACA